MLPTITHIHMSVIPVLAGGGTVFLDRRAHKTIYDGAKIARGHGARVQRYEHDDLDHLEQLLKEAPGGRRLICMDGVNSMTGNVPDLAAFARWPGSTTPCSTSTTPTASASSASGADDEPCPRQPGQQHRPPPRRELRQHHSRRRVLQVVLLPAGLHRPAHLAEEHLKVAAPPYLYSGPSPTASLATVLAGFDVNATRGDAIRADLYRKTTGSSTRRQLGWPRRTPRAARSSSSRSTAAKIDDVGGFLFDRGIYVTLAAYPLVPRDEVGFRVQVTAANTDEEIEQLVDVLAEAADVSSWPAPGTAPLRTARLVRASGGILAPLRERNFALLWTGMTVSLVGDGVLLVALAWQVYELSNAPAAMAVVGLAMTIPHVASCCSAGWSATASTAGG